MSENPFLQVQPTELKKEININKFVGQVAMGVAVALSVRFVIAKLDWFIGKRKASQ